MYDLLIKRAHVLDPAEHLDGVRDLAIQNGLIQAIEADIPLEAAKKTIEMQGPNRYVVPGLIDLHTHVAYGAYTPGVSWHGVDPDVAGVHSGVTALVDAGSTGAYNFGIFPTHIVPRAKTRLICFLNLGSDGLLHIRKREPDIAAMEEIDRHAIARCIEANEGSVSGIKLRLVGPLVEHAGEDLVRTAKDVALEHHLPLMVHIGDGLGKSTKAHMVTRYLLRTLEQGDILTHLCTHHEGGVMDQDMKPAPELREARANGVVLDPALGMNHLSYEIARRQADLGFHPDTISTDLTVPGRSTVAYSLTECMAKFMALGYSLSDVVRMTTTNPARALGLQNEIGSIAVGHPADLSVIDVVAGRWKFTDARKSTLVGEHAIVPVQTIRGGQLHPIEWGPHRWGWLPEEA